MLKNVQNDFMSVLDKLHSALSNMCRVLLTFILNSLTLSSFRRYLKTLLSVSLSCPLRIVDYWNKLPDNVVSAATISSFKNRLDIWMDRYRH